MAFVCKIVVLVTFLSFCDSFTQFGSSILRVSSTQLSAAAKPLVDLSVDDIAARWRVVKFGQGSNGYNGIELADRLLAQKTVKIPMSRVGGLGLDLMEYNLGKGDLGLILVGGVIPDSNADKCGQFLPGDALESITSIATGEMISNGMLMLCYFALIFQLFSDHILCLFHRLCSS